MMSMLNLLKVLALHGLPQEIKFLAFKSCNVQFS